MVDMNNETITASTPAWTISCAAWKYANGYPDPHVCEISPMQYAHLSKRAKAQYDEKRRQEWDASAAGSAAYAALVLKAHADGLLDHRDNTIHRDARGVVAAELIRRDEKAKKDAEAAERASRQLAHADLVVGMEVFHPIYRECVIEKVNRKSVILRNEMGTIKACTHFLSRRASQ